MASQKKILKVFIVIILIVFLASTALMSVLYLSNRGTDETATTTWDILEETEETTSVIDENIILTGEAEEAFE